MKLISSLSEMTRYSKKAGARDQTIALVPTMGALHEGHLSLVGAAKTKANITVVSIFVNPIQFGPGEDFLRYPRELGKDKKKLAAFDPVVIFNPAAEDMYAKGFSTDVRVNELGEKLCGKFRPGHFDGVATVVAKLFNIVKPDFAFFGQKDYQQQVIIKRMARDLNFDLEVISLPTVREYDGLALSSRNQYLSPEERKAAPALYRALVRAKGSANRGIKDPRKLADLIKETLAAEPLIKTEYVSVVDPDTLDDIHSIKGKALIAAAIFIGRTRLIDNILIKEK